MTQKKPRWTKEQTFILKKAYTKLRKENPDLTNVTIYRILHERYFSGPKCIKACLELMRLEEK